MDKSSCTYSTTLNIERWEQDLVRLTAARIRTTDREELEAELSSHLLHVKRRHRRRVRHWKAYLRTALENRAKNWIRDSQQNSSGMVSLDAPEGSDESLSLVDRMVSSEPGPDAGAAIAAAWQGMAPELRKLWQVLLEENGNQTRAAARMKMHRNTMRIWTRRIQKILNAHGF
jgi:DNA-binding PucR family transcriptional regulator